jgi:RNA polymerase sigma-70 factor, ECF subfamily
VTGDTDATPAGGDLHDATDEQVLAVYADPDRPRGTREAAFHELVRRFQRRVFAVCHRTLRDPADAEDATQEVFVRLARNAGTFRGDAKLSTWLYTVARNVATDRVRHDARRPATPVEDVAEVADTRAHADDEVGARATAIDLARALDRLDAISRQLLVLVAVEGLSYAEAAAASDLAVGTVKSRVSRARVQLGELLAAPDPETTAPHHHAPTRPTGPEPFGAHRPRGPPSGA